MSIQIDLINLEATQSTKPNFKSLVGNACDLHEFADMSYDLVHSNSLIEHVGTWDAMLKVASNVRRLAPAYFVQTPYFWFPIEPHFRFPLFHWLPESWRYRLIMMKDLGYIKKASTVSDAVRRVQSAVLLDRGQFSALFPDAEIRNERAFGLTKSLMAVRRGS
jgi:Methyltransferase domain